jgi:predicted metal-dependent HD superfamily phosphohydrolase
MDHLAHLTDRWNVLLPGAAALGVELLDRYQHVGRRYHDARHLVEVLGHIDELGAFAADPRAVELAGWFHDAVYDASRPDNEEASARFAEDALPSYDVAPQTVAHVAGLVRLTAAHDPEKGDADGAVLCDADLAILAADPLRYAEYVQDVRAEYHRISEQTFRERRSVVLWSLLQRPTVFCTAEGIQRWESKARRNLETELRRMDRSRG